MKYSMKEIIEIAIGLEKAGYAFYKECSKKFEEDSTKEIFEFLASEELHHKEVFESMKEPVTRNEGIFNEEYFGYLETIIGSRIFGESPQTNDVISGIKSPIDAIKKAFNDEKDSILFYSEVKNLYKNDESQTKLLDEIIEEERKHVLALQDLFNKIKLTV